MSVVVQQSGCGRIPTWMDHCKPGTAATHPGRPIKSCGMGSERVGEGGGGGL